MTHPSALWLPFFLPVLVLGVTISNVKPKVDTDGDIINVGDGCITYHNKLYYVYGVKYQCCEEPDNSCYTTGAGPGLSKCNSDLPSKVLGCVTQRDLCMQ